MYLNLYRAYTRPLRFAIFWEIVENFLKTLLKLELLSLIDTPFFSTNRINLGMSNTHWVLYKISQNFENLILNSNFEYYHGIRMLFLVVSIFIISIIAFDRYQMISSIHRHSGITKYIIYSFAVWIISFILAAPEFYFSEVANLGEYNSYCRVMVWKNYFWRKTLFLTKIFIVHENFYFWRKFLFFDENF